MTKYENWSGKYVGYILQEDEYTPTISVIVISDDDGVVFEVASRPPVDTLEEARAAFAPEEVGVDIVFFENPVVDNGMGIWLSQLFKANPQISA